MPVCSVRITPLGILFATAFLAGCTSTQSGNHDAFSLPEIGFDPAAANDINNIAILPPSVPESVSLTEVVTPSPGGSALDISSGPGGGGGAGLIVLAPLVAVGVGVAIAQEAAEANRENRLTGLLEERNFLLEEYLTERLANELEAQGYTTQRTSISRPTQNLIEENTLNSIPLGASVDAVLDVVIQEYGWLAEDREDDDWIYRPRLLVQAQLIDRNDKTVLMRRNVFSEYSLDNTDMSLRLPSMGPILFEADGDNQIIGADALETNVDVAINGLRDLASKSAEIIARELGQEGSPGRFYIASSVQDEVAKRFTPATGRCTVYIVYEDETLLNQGQPQWLYEDSSPIAIAYPNYYSAITLKPGRHEISLSADANYTNRFGRREFDCPDSGVMYMATEYKRLGSAFSSDYQLRSITYSLRFLNENEGRRAVLESRLLRIPEEILTAGGTPVFRFRN